MNCLLVAHHQSVTNGMKDKVLSALPFFYLLRTKLSWYAWLAPLFSLLLFPLLAKLLTCSFNFKDALDVEEKKRREERKKAKL
jgi:hypothetical protein